MAKVLTNQIRYGILPPMIKFDLLANDEIFGHKMSCNPHAYITYHGTKCHTTDLAILTSGTKSVICPGNIPYFTKSAYGTKCKTVGSDGSPKQDFPSEKCLAIRPATNSAKILKTGHPVFKHTDYSIVEFGAFPQKMANDETTQDLENLFKKGFLAETEKVYTFNSVKRDANEPFKPLNVQEYSHENEKFIRYKYFTSSATARLSDGYSYSNGKLFWLKVSPIQWAVDNKTGRAVSINALVGGIPMKDNTTLYDGDFKNTVISRWLDEHFSPMSKPKRLSFFEKMREDIYGI